MFLLLTYKGDCFSTINCLLLAFIETQDMSKTDSGFFLSYLPSSINLYPQVKAVLNPRHWPPPIMSSLHLNLCMWPPSSTYMPLSPRLSCLKSIRGIDLLPPLGNVRNRLLICVCDLPWSINFYPQVKAVLNPRHSMLNAVKMVSHKISKCKNKVKIF